jgi:hypothetical protein
MSIEDFVKREYGSRSSSSSDNITTSTRRAKKTKESYQSYYKKFYNPNKENSLKNQRIRMQERRQDFTQMMDLGIIERSKSGIQSAKDSFEKMKDKETRPEVEILMSKLSDEQLAGLSEIVDRRAKGILRNTKLNIFSGMVDRAKSMRGQGLMSEGVNIAQQGDKLSYGG